MTPTRRSAHQFVVFIERGMKASQAAAKLGVPVRAFASYCQRRQPDLWRRWKDARPGIDRALGETLLAAYKSDNPRMREGLSRRAISRVCGCSEHVISRIENAALLKVRHLLI